MGVTAGIFFASILLKEMRYLVYIRYLWLLQRNLVLLWQVPPITHQRYLSMTLIIELFYVIVLNTVVGNIKKIHDIPFSICTPPPPAI
jgi:hypothetical protein